MKTSIPTDQLFASFESSIAAIDEAETLPPARCTDPEFHEFEKDAICLHRGMHDVIPSALARFPDLPADTAGYSRYNGTTHMDGAVNPLQRCILKPFFGFTDKQRNEVSFANVPPTLTMGSRSDQISYLIPHAE